MNLSHFAQLKKPADVAKRPLSEGIRVLHSGVVSPKLGHFDGILGKREGILVYAGSRVAVKEFAMPQNRSSERGDHWEYTYSKEVLAKMETDVMTLFWTKLSNNYQMA